MSFQVPNKFQRETEKRSYTPNMPTSPARASAFAFRDFRLFQAGRALATIASQVQGVAVGWQVYEHTHRALDLGYVGLAQFAPAMGLSLVTGHVADVFDRRRIVALCNLGLAACSLLLFFLAREGNPSVTLIYAVLVLVGVARAFSGPASQSLLPRIVPESVFPSAVALGSSIMQAARIVGPALGGVYYGALHAAAPVYATCAGMSLAAMACYAAMRVRAVPPAPKNAVDAGPARSKVVLAGVHYVWRNKILLGAISLDLFAVLLGGAVALLPVYARDILSVGPWGFGLLRSAPAIGGVLTGILLAYRPVRRRAGLMMFACVALFGASTIVFGVSRAFPLSLAALLVVGASDMVSVFVRQTLVQLTTPDEMRGRVSAVNLVFVGASNELGEFESGLTAQWLGAVPAVIAGGVGTLVVVAIWMALFPSLREVDRLRPETKA